MKLSFKNIALALGIAVGAAAVTVVITTKGINSISDKTPSKNKDKSANDNKFNDDLEDDILYV